MNLVVITAENIAWLPWRYILKYEALMALSAEKFPTLELSNTDTGRFIVVGCRGVTSLNTVEQCRKFCNVFVPFGKICNISAPFAKLPIINCFCSNRITF